MWDLDSTRWDELAQYNSERARGIVHTPEWQLRMVEVQQEFDLMMRREYPSLEASRCR